MKKIMDGKRARLMAVDFPNPPLPVVMDAVDLAVVGKIARMAP